MVAVVSPANGFGSPQTPIEVERGTLGVASWSRQARLVGLRRAIESGEYQVSASDLAEALLRVASFGLIEQP